MTTSGSNIINRIILITAIILLVFLSFYAYNRLQDLIKHGRIADKNIQIKQKLEEALSLMKDIGQSQRSFILTQDSSFLTIHDKTVSYMSPIFQELEHLTANNKGLYKLIKEIRFLSEQRLVILKKIINDPHKNVKEALTKHLQTDNISMTKIKGAVGRVNEQMSVLLVKGNTEKEKYFAITPSFMAFFFISALVIILYSYFLLERQLRKRVEMQKELEYNIEALKRSNIELERFAYVASHDLQEPLRKIQSFGTRLVAKYSNKLDEDGEFMIDRMQNAAERMQNLINDLLNYSRLSNSSAIILKTIDLDAILQSTLEDLSITIAQKNAIIKRDKLPLVNGNFIQFQQLFQNLLSNALKFSKTNETLNIQITHNEVFGKSIENVKEQDITKPFHKICVIDNGIGFDQEYADKIFVIFQRLHGKMDYPGTGIGLAICKKIVSLHHGYITANSSMGKGATFCIYIPKKL